MPIKGKKSTANEDGVDKEVYTVAFTNGALEELEQLQQKFHLPSLESVLKLSIAFLSRVGDNSDESKSKSE